MSYQRHSRADRARIARGQPAHIDRRAAGIDRHGEPPRQWWWQASEIDRANPRVAAMLACDGIDPFVAPMLVEDIARDRIDRVAPIELSNVTADLASVRFTMTVREPKESP